jgi:hypothetical protein
VFRIASKKHGVLPLGKTRVMLMRSNSSCLNPFITCGLVALSMVTAMLFGALAAYYAMFMLFAYLFAMAVYYTVKLM